METQKLTRAQRRINQRVNIEAQQAYSKLAKAFFDFFMDNDPASQEVKEKEDEVCKKWIMYCKQRGLIPEVFDQMSIHCASVRKDYNEQ